MIDRGYFGIGVWHIKSEVNIGTLMRSAYAFGAKFAFTIGRRYSRQSGDTCNAMEHLPLYHFTAIDELLRFLPQRCRLIGVELSESAKPLEQYWHPTQACYLLGAEDHGLNAESIQACHQLVQIPGRMCLNVASAGTVVMYDRIAKHARVPDEYPQFDFTPILPAQEQSA